MTYRFDVECKRGPAMTSEGLPNLNIDYRFLHAAGLMKNQGQLKDKIGVKSRLQKALNKCFDFLTRNTIES